MASTIQKSQKKAHRAIFNSSSVEVLPYNTTIKKAFHFLQMTGSSKTTGENSEQPLLYNCRGEVPLERLMPAECKLHIAESETDLTKAMHPQILDSEHKLYQRVYMKMLRIVSSVDFLKIHYSIRCMVSKFRCDYKQSFTPKANI